jgi:hypothetical protein
VKPPKRETSEEKRGTSGMRSLREKRGTSGNLQTAEPPGENVEPPHLYAEILCLGSPSARVEIRLLH